MLDTVTEDYSLNTRRHFGAVGSVGEGFWVTKRKFCGRLAGERRERKSRFRLHLCFDACAFLNILALSFALLSKSRLRVPLNASLLCARQTVLFRNVCRNCPHDGADLCCEWRLKGGLTLLFSLFAVRMLSKSV